MAWESQDDGFIAKILLQEGAKDIPVGTPAMIFVEEEVCYLAAAFQQAFLLHLLNALAEYASPCWQLSCHVLVAA